MVSNSRWDGLACAFDGCTQDYRLRGGLSVLEGFLPGCERVGSRVVAFGSGPPEP